MKIGVNLLPYNEIGGIAIYIQHLLENFGNLDKKNSFIIFTGRKMLPIFKFDYANFHYIETPIDSYRKIKRVFYEQFIFPFLLKKYKIDVLFNPSVSGPIFWPGKKIVVIHDCAYDRFKEFDSFKTKVYFKLMFCAITKFSSKIITVSNFSRKELSDLYKINPKKIEVIYEGVPVLPKVNNDFVRETLNKFGIDQPYFLYVGNWRPRKNIIGLIEAFGIFIKNNNLNYLLVIGGKKDRRFLNLEKYINENRLGEKVILTDFLTRKEISAFYKKAEALTFPSFYEGFGLPILEAQSLGVPILASNIPSMFEIAGEGAIFINPNSSLIFSKGMKEISFNEKLRKDLIKKGFKNIKRFSWEKTAENLLKLFCDF